MRLATRRTRQLLRQRHRRLGSFMLRDSRTMHSGCDTAGADTWHGDAACRVFERVRVGGQFVRVEYWMDSMKNGVLWLLGLV
jgi:hypothetical protein